MRNPKFVRYNAVLLGLVVLRTKAQNGFCPMCTKECHIVLTRSKSFWGQFWGQNGKADSHTHQSNKCAAFVSLRKADTSITEFPRRKSRSWVRKPQRRGIWGGIWLGGHRAPMRRGRAQTGAFLAVTGAVCGNAAGGHTTSC